MLQGARCSKGSSNAPQKRSHPLAGWKRAFEGLTRAHIDHVTCRDSMLRTVLSIVLALVVLLHALATRRGLLQQATVRRVTTASKRLRIFKLEMRRQRAAGARPRLAVQMEIGARTESLRLARLRELTRTLESLRQRRFEERRQAEFARAPTTASVAADASGWHVVDPDGACPASVPDWDWQLLLKAAEASDDPPKREAALTELAANSNMRLGELGDLSNRY